MMKNTPSITQLQEDWHKLPDLERARAVQAIVSRSGLSIPKIAAQLQLSESLLRHLLQALQAPASDRDLARQGTPLCANMCETSRPWTITIGRGKKSHFEEHKQDKHFFGCVGSFGA